MADSGNPFDFSSGATSNPFDFTAGSGSGGTTTKKAAKQPVKPEKRLADALARLDRTEGIMRRLGAGKKDLAQVQAVRKHVESYGNDIPDEEYDRLGLDKIGKSKSFIDQAKGAGGSLLTGALDLIDRPRNAVATAGVEGSKERQGGGSLLDIVKAQGSGLAAGITGKKHTTSQDIIDTTGLPQPEGDSIAAKVGRFAEGTAIDVATDPLTYLTLGTTAGAKAGLKAVEEVGGKELAETVARQGTKKALDETSREAVRKVLVDQAEAAGARNADKTAAKVLKSLDHGAGGGLKVAGRTVVPGSKLGAIGEAVTEARPAHAIGRKIGESRIGDFGATLRQAFVPRAEVADRFGKRVAGDVYKAGALSDAAASVADDDLVTQLRSAAKAAKATRADLETIVMPALDVGGDVAETAAKLRTEGRDGLAGLVEHLDDLRHDFTASQVEAGILPAEHLADVENYVPLIPTKEGERLLGKGAEKAAPYLNLEPSELQSAFRQGGFTNARSEALRGKALPEAERILNGALGLPEGTALFQRNPLLAFAARASSAGHALAKADYLDKLTTLTDDAGQPILRKVGDATAATDTKAALDAAKAAKKEAERKVKVAEGALRGDVAPPQFKRALGGPLEGLRRQVAGAGQAVGSHEIPLRPAGRGIAEKRTATLGLPVSTEQGLAGKGAGTPFRGSKLRQLDEQLATATAAHDAAKVAHKEAKAALKASTKGWEKISVQGLGTFEAPPAMAREIRRVESVVLNDRALQNFSEGVNRITTLWKGYATVPVLFGGGFHARNALGNVFNNFLAGDIGVRDYARATRIQKAFMSARHDAEVATIGVEEAARRRMSAADFRAFTEARNHGVIETGFFASDLSAKAADGRIGRAVKGGTAGKLGAALNPLSPENLAIRQGRAVGSAIENNARMAHFLGKLRSTGSAEEAASSVRKFLFDYGDLTAFEQQKMKQFIAFYTYMRKNTPLQIAALARNPGKFSALAHIRENAAAAVGSESGVYPQYAVEEGSIPVAGGKLMLGPDTPAGAAAQALEPVVQAAGFVPGLRSLVPKGARAKDGGAVARSLVNVPSGPLPEVAKVLGQKATGKSFFTGGKAPEGTLPRQLAEAFLPIIGKAERSPLIDRKRDRLISALTGLNAVDVTDARQRAEMFRRLAEVEGAITDLKKSGIDVPTLTDLRKKGLVKKAPRKSTGSGPASSNPFDF